MKYFNIDELSVGCLGTMVYHKESEWPEWNKKKYCPYAIYRENTCGNIHEGIDIFSRENYYFLNEASRKNFPVEVAQEKYIISKSVPLSIVCESGKDKISSVELKSIICIFNITDALIKHRDDNYLILLKSCLDDIDLIGNGKIKEDYIRRIAGLIDMYCHITFISFDQEQYDIAIEYINNIRHEIDIEKEVLAVKRRELKEKKKTRKLQ